MVLQNWCLLTDFYWDCNVPDWDISKAIFKSRGFSMLSLHFYSYNEWLRCVATITLLRTHVIIPWHIATATSSSWYFTRDSCSWLEEIQGFLRHISGGGIREETGTAIRWSRQWASAILCYSEASFWIFGPGLAERWFNSYTGSMPSNILTRINLQNRNYQPI